MLCCDIYSIVANISMLTAHVVFVQNNIKVLQLLLALQTSVCFFSCLLMLESATDHVTTRSLQEYYVMVQWIAQPIFEDERSFEQSFIEPITRGRDTVPGFVTLTLRLCLIWLIRE
jgi:hypothetical protein